jgi:hypothetical protein
MTSIKNADTIRELIKGANLQTGFDQIPNELARSIVPTLEVNPAMFRRCNIVRGSSAINATTQTIYTTPTDRDFFLCGCSLNVIKDVTSTTTRSDIICNPDGDTSQSVLRVSCLTLTPQTGQQSQVFPFPIKLKRGSNITVTNDTNVANVTSSGCIVGYTVY